MIYLVVYLLLTVFSITYLYEHENLSLLCDWEKNFKDILSKSIFLLFAPIFLIITIFYDKFYDK